MLNSELKIISWNLNGLNAALSRGLVDFINCTLADIYAFQETKVYDPKFPLQAITVIRPLAPTDRPTQGRCV